MRRLARVSPAAWFLVAAGAVLVLLFFRSFLPWLTAERQQTASTPGLGALFQRVEVPVNRGRQACIAPVDFSPETQIARLRVLAKREPVPPLLVTASAPGYRSRARIANYTVGGDTLVVANLKDPSQVRHGKFCIKNVGRHQIRLIGTNESRSLTTAQTTIDGKPIGETDVELTFLHRGQRTYVAAVGDALRHASLLFSWTPAWLLWVLMLALVIGVPAATLFALARAFAQTP